MPLLVALSLALFPSLVGCQGSNADTARVRGWQRDLDSVVSTARRVHASPLRPAHAPAFDEAANRLAAHIPDLPDSRVMVELQRLLAILGDGHSLVYPVAGPRASFDMLPVDVWLFEDGLFIVGGVASARDLVGSKVLRIGSLSTEQVLSRMAPYVSRDNAMGLKAFATLYLILPGFLAAWGATENLHQVSLTLVDTLGQTRVVRLEAGASRRIAKRLHPPPHTRSPSPLYLREAERPFWITHLSDAHALFFQFNQVSDTPDRTIAQFARMLTDTLRSLAASRLIIDVRHNTGGNNQLLSPLVNAITSYAAGDTARRLYVLTSRSTFSAAQNFINRVERSTPTAIFAGEPSMSSPNFTGEDNPFRLPFSGLVVSISNRYWQDSRADDRRPWIAPHLPVALQSTDWLHNADPVLDAVLRDIYSSRRGGSPKQ